MSETEMAPTIGKEMDRSSTHSNSTIKLTTRTTRSFPSFLLHTLTRPFRPRLVKPPKDQSPDGSPTLMFPASIYEKAEVKEKTIATIKLYEFSARLPPGLKYGPKHDLYYFAGGAFCAPPSNHHWKLCAELARQLPGYRVHIVSYPLAPKNPAGTSLSAIQKLGLELCRRAEKAKRSITLAGDSSGGNIALSLAIFLANAAIKEGDNRIPLKNVFLISPATDLRNLNPAIIAADRVDPLMSKSYTSWVAKQWAQDLPLDNPELSPILADLTSLRTLGVKIHGILGTYDVLAPDAIAFRKRCEEFGISGNWLEWEKQIHCFPLTWAYHIPEGVQGKDWILDVLRDNEGRA